MEPEEPIAFPQVGEYGPYYKWKAEKEYHIDDVVFHEGYLYRLMGNPDEEDPLDPYVSVGEDPKTATFSCDFNDESGVNTLYGGEPGASLTMRRWMLFDLPAGYYHALLRGFKKDGLISYQASPFCRHMNMICVRAFAKIRVPEEPDPPDERLSTAGYIDWRTPVTECSYAGYRINSGLNATYSESELVGGGLIYSFTAIDNAYADTRNQSFERNEDENERSLIWMPNTVTCYNGVPDNANGVENDGNGFSTDGGLHSMHSSMQVFSREFTGRYYDDDGNPSVSTVTSVAFEDGWTQTTQVGIYPWSTSPDYATE